MDEKRRQREADRRAKAGRRARKREIAAETAREAAEKRRSAVEATRWHPEAPFRVPEMKTDPGPMSSPPRPDPRFVYQEGTRKGVPIVRARLAERVARLREKKWLEVRGAMTDAGAGAWADAMVPRFVDLRARRAVYQAVPAEIDRPIWRMQSAALDATRTMARRSR